MFRVTLYVFNTRNFLNRCRWIDYRLASITRFTPANAVKTEGKRPRETCPPLPPPPSKPPKDDRWFWGAMAVLVVTGAGIMTAKNSPEIRDWMTLYAPWLDDLIAVLYQENMTYEEYAAKYLEDVKKYITNFPNRNLPKECLPESKQIADIPQKPKREIKKEDCEEVEPSKPIPPPVLTLCICEIDNCLKELGDIVISNYYTAKEACAYYNSFVDETMQTFSLNSLKKLRHAKEEREGLVKESLKNAKEAIQRLDEMIQYLDCGVQATKDEIENTKLLYRNYRQMYKAAYMKYQWANDKALVRDRQWEMLEAVVKKYMSENESMYPGLKYDMRKPQLKGDVDILLYNTYRYVRREFDLLYRVVQMDWNKVKKLNKDLTKVSSTMSERVNRAYNMLSTGDVEKDKARNAKVQAALAARRARRIKSLSKGYSRHNITYDDQKLKNDQLLKEMTDKQLQRHLELLETKVAQKEAEIEEKFVEMVEEQVAAEKRILDMQLDDMAVKLKHLEDKLNVRLKAEREARRCQELWAAGAALLAATKKGDPHVDVNKQLDAIEKAADGEDKLVLTVLKSIPKSVRQEGLVPESVLKKKYKIMERTALRVSLVEDDGGPMPVYILSWLQSLFLFMKLSGIPQAEFDSPPKEPSKDLDTFDLLQRSRFWLEQDNLAMALIYVNNLQGASRLAAHTWYEAARTHLEVRQAAEAVLAHAAAMGLQYI